MSISAAWGRKKEALICPVVTSLITFLEKVVELHYAYLSILLLRPPDGLSGSNVDV